MDKIYEYHQFLENEILNKNDFLTESIENNEDYVNEIYSSEFFEYEQILESVRDKYEEEIYREYRRIRPQLVKGKQTKELTEKYFELEKQNLRRRLELDRSYLKRTTQKIIESLEALNEEDYDLYSTLERTDRIVTLRSYQRKTIRQINRELKELDKFYDSNPKILVI